MHTDTYVPAAAGRNNMWEDLDLRLDEKVPQLLIFEVLDVN